MGAGAGSSRLVQSPVSDSVAVSEPPGSGAEPREVADPYAIDEQTAIKVVDGSVQVVSEGQWTKFGS
jgi:hypothetical protein